MADNQQQLLKAQRRLTALREAPARLRQERDQLDQQVRELLSAVEAVRSAPNEAASWQPEADLYKLADKVRKERGE